MLDAYVSYPEFRSALISPQSAISLSTSQQGGPILEIGPVEAYLKQKLDISAMTHQRTHRLISRCAICIGLKLPYRYN